MRPGDGRPLAGDLDLIVAGRLGVETFEPRDLGEHIVAQRRPVKFAIGHLPANAPCILQILGEMRAIDEKLLGHAATDHPGAATPLLLRHRTPPPISCSTPATPPPPPPPPPTPKHNLTHKH